jgi:hypothetical protein
VYVPAVEYVWVERREYEPLVLVTDMVPLEPSP